MWRNSKYRFLVGWASPYEGQDVWLHSYFREDDYTYVVLSPCETDIYVGTISSFVDNYGLDYEVVTVIEAAYE